MKKRIVIVGAGGSGKDYLASKLTDLGYEKSVNYTTRPPRDTEEDGKDYHYITKKEFKQMIKEGEFHEYTEFNKWFYGTSVYSWLNCSVFIATPSGISKIKEEDRKECFIVYLNISESIRRDRISKRSDADSIERRIAADREDFKDFKDFDFLVEDNEFDFWNIINAWNEEKAAEML